jgi:hypothetical protein
MGVSAEKMRLEMKAKYSSKEAYDKKIGIVRRRVEAKEAYVSALQDHLHNLQTAIKETDGLYRSGYAVEYFEVAEKLNTQKAILSQHKTYLEEMQKIAPNE